MTPLSALSPMMDYHINIFYSEEDGGYIADIPDLGACSAFGATPEEALKEVQIAKDGWIEAAHSEGKPIPRPGSTGRYLSSRVIMAERGTEIDIAAFTALAGSLARLGPDFHHRGWVLGTSGNFSAVVSHDPMRLAITSSSVDKGELTADHILQIDGEGNVLGAGRPSAETLLHLTVVRLRGAGTVLHTHSVWSNILSDAYSAEAGLSIEGYEMLKGLEGVSTHEHREWLPIIENSQDMSRLARSVETALNEHPGAHGFLLRRHGLYTWGKNIAETKRHVEILEFLLEVLGRTYRAAR